MTDKEWKDYAKGLIKGELAKRNINFVMLADKLSQMGVHENPQNLSNKIARGSFNAVFMLQVFAAIECKSVDLRDFT